MKVGDAHLPTQVGIGLPEDLELLGDLPGRVGEGGLEPDIGVGVQIGGHVALVPVVATDALETPVPSHVFPVQADAPDIQEFQAGQVVIPLEGIPFRRIGQAPQALDEATSSLAAIPGSLRVRIHVVVAIGTAGNRIALRVALDGRDHLELTGLAPVLTAMHVEVHVDIVVGLQAKLPAGGPVVAIVHPFRDGCGFSHYPAPVQGRVRVEALEVHTLREGIE